MEENYPGGRGGNCIGGNYSAGIFSGAKTRLVIVLGEIHGWQLSDQPLPRRKMSGYR